MPLFFGTDERETRARLFGDDSGENAAIDQLRGILHVATLDGPVRVEDRNEQGGGRAIFDRSQLRPDPMPDPFEEMALGAVFGEEFLATRPVARHVQQRLMGVEHFATIGIGDDREQRFRSAPQDLVLKRRKLRARAGVKIDGADSTLLNVIEQLTHPFVATANGREDARSQTR